MKRHPLETSIGIAAACLGCCRCSLFSVMNGWRHLRQMSGGEESSSRLPSLVSAWASVTKFEMIRRAWASHALLYNTFLQHRRLQRSCARIIGSSRREVKPLLIDKPFNITPHNKPSTTQSFANDSDGRYPSPPAFGRGHYAPSPRSTKETVKDPGNSTPFSDRSSLK
jgi:hypothetical protein